MKNENIKTSVIIPVYNTERYLEECINSVLAQSQKEIEVIIVDDGSTDGSSAIIRAYADKYPFITAIYQENQKQGAARNAGAKLAKGEYIYFLDSDDCIAPNALEECYFQAKEKNLDILLFDAFEFEDIMPAYFSEQNDCQYNRSGIGITEAVLSGVEFWNRYYAKHGVLHCPPLIYIRREFFLLNDLFFMSGVFYEDAEWITRLYMCAERVWYYPRRFYYRRYRAGSVMKSDYSIIHLLSSLEIVVVLLKNINNTSLQMHKNMLFDILKLLCRRAYQIANCLETKNELRKNASCIFHTYERMNCAIRQYFKLEQELRIGIFGTGKMCDKLFAWYENKDLRVNAKIFFIETTNQKKEYRNCTIYEVKKASELDLDHVIISSPKYEKEMKDSLKKYSVRVESICTVYSELLQLAKYIELLA